MAVIRPVKQVITKLLSRMFCCMECNSKLLSEMFYVSESNSKRLSDLSGLEIVCQTLRTHMNSSDVVEATAACLLSLSMEGLS